MAYTELMSDDYLTSRGRSGFFISENAPRPVTFDPPRPQAGVDWPSMFGRRFSGGAELVKPADWARHDYPFIYGQADAGLFDHANWRRAAVKALGQREFGTMTADTSNRDDPMLLDYLARHALPRRGIIARHDEILVTMGAQNALWLTAQVLMGPGRLAAMEDPGYPGMRAILEQAEGAVAAVPVDDHGLPPDRIPRGTHVVFTTPGHQCPTGAKLPAARRADLLRRAEADNFIIVEDDYDFELAAAPEPSLKSMDGAGRVIHVGSFSKTLFPGLRLGYLVGDAAFIREARALRSAVLRHPPGHTQRTVAIFLSLGHYDALMRRMARTIGARRRALDAAVQTFGLTTVGRPEPGASSIWLAASEGVDTAAVARQLQAQSVLIEPGAAFFAHAGTGSRHFRLAVTSIAEDRIAPGISKIAAAMA